MCNIFSRITKIIITNMLLKYIVLLFFIYSFGIAKPIDNEEIAKLWKMVTKGNVNPMSYIPIFYLNIYLKHLTNDEVKKLHKRYGQIYWWHRLYLKDRWYYDSFEKAVNDGEIPRWPLEDMRAVFNEVLPQNESKDYVTLSDMIEYYSQIKSTDIENIMENYGIKEDGQRRLYFKGFVKAMNLNLIPAPKSWEDTYLKVMQPLIIENATILVPLKYYK